MATNKLIRQLLFSSCLWATAVMAQPSNAPPVALVKPAPLKIASLKPLPPQPAKPAVPAFEQMLVYVYLQNPQLVAQRKSLQMEDEHVSQAFAGFRPTLSATGEAGRQRESIQGEEWLYGPDAAGSLIAIQPIFNGFGTLEQFRAAKARVKSARARLLATEQQVLFEAIGIWLSLCEKERIVAYNLDNLGRMYKFLNAARMRFKAGDATRTDMAQAESRLADAEGHYATAQADYESLQASYIRLTGVHSPVTYFPPFVKELPQNLQDTDVRARNHPELVEAYDEEVAAKHDIDAVSSSLWPSVYLRGEVSESRSPELDLARLRDDSITVNVSIPLYQGGAEYSRIREAKIAHDRSHDVIEQTLLSVLERARQSWYNYYAACQVIRTSRMASDAAGRALSGVTQEQTQGLRSTIDVLNAESEFLNTQLAEVQAEKNTRLEGYRLLASMGELTAQGLHLPTTIYDPLTHYDQTARRAIGF